jgi:hypothetical protein
MDESLNRQHVVHPAMAEMRSYMEKKQRIARLLKVHKDKAYKNAVRHNVGLDIPRELHNALLRIAEKEHISVSGLIIFYLYRGVVDHGAWNAELSPYKHSHVLAYSRTSSISQKWKNSEVTLLSYRRQ